MATKRSVTSQENLLFMAFPPSTAMGMAQKEAYENRIFRLKG